MFAHLGVISGDTLYNYDRLQLAFLCALLETKSYVGSKIFVVIAARTSPTSEILEFVMVRSRDA